MLLAGATVIRSLGWVEGWTLKICYMALARGFSYGLLPRDGWLSPRANGPKGSQKECVPLTKMEVAVSV